MLSVTHVAFDGVGSLRLLQSVSRLYASEDDPSRTSNPSRRSALSRSDAARAGLGPPLVSGRPDSLRSSGDRGRGSASSTSTLTQPEPPPPASPP